MYTLISFQGYESNSAKDGCDICPIGMMKNSSQTECESCPVGYHTDEQEGATECKPCAAVSVPVALTLTNDMTIYIVNDMTIYVAFSLHDK